MPSPVNSSENESDEECPEAEFVCLDPEGGLMNKD